MSDDETQDGEPPNKKVKFSKKNGKPKVDEEDSEKDPAYTDNECDTIVNLMIKYQADLEGDRVPKKKKTQIYKLITRHLDAYVYYLHAITCFSSVSLAQFWDFLLRKALAPLANYLKVFLSM